MDNLSILFSDWSAVIINNALQYRSHMSGVCQDFLQNIRPRNLLAPGCSNIPKLKNILRQYTLVKFRSNFQVIIIEAY